MQMILYQYPGGDGLPSLSPPCFRVEMALRLTGAEYEVVNLTRASDVNQVSPTGRVPALAIDGNVSVDSTVILDQLENHFPGAFHPQQAEQRREDRLWEHFINDHMYWQGFYLRWVAFSDRTFTAVFGRAPWITRLLIKRFFMPQMKKRAMAQGVGRRSLEGVLADVARGMDMITAGLRGGPFLQGRERPGRGDLAVASLMLQAGFRDSLPEMQRLFLARTALVEHSKRVLDACSMEYPRALKRGTI